MDSISETMKACEAIISNSIKKSPSVMGKVGLSAERVRELLGQQPCALLQFPDSTAKEPATPSTVGMYAKLHELRVGDSTAIPMEQRASVYSYSQYYGTKFKTRVNKQTQTALVMRVK